MLEQWLRTHATRARFHAPASLLTLTSPRASGRNTVHVTLDGTTTLSLEKVENNDTALVLVAIDGHQQTSQTLLVFRDEADAKAALNSATQALFGGRSLASLISRCVRFLLTVLLTLLVLLALVVVWKGFDASRINQRAMAQAQATAGPVAPGTDLTPDQIVALRQAVARQGQAQSQDQGPNPQAPLQSQPPVSQPQQDAAPAPASPGDAVARGLEGN
jgi:preprotein translocase subunit SecG